MKKIFYLSTCGTCKRIISEMNTEGFELQDIKKQHINAAELDELAQIVGTYEALFSRKAQKYRAEGWHERTLTEADYRTLILGEYTFLKRPIVADATSVSAGGKTLTAL